LPLTPGAHWQDKGECEGETIEISAQTVRSESRTVNGKTLKTFLVRSTIVLTGPQYNATTHTDAWVSPAYRLIVHSTEDTKGSYSGTSFIRSFDETLKSVTPA